MIKIIYEQEKYYLEGAGKQPYDIKTEVELDEDISSDEAIVAFMKILNLATYRVSIDTLKRTIRDLEDDGYAPEERVI